MSDPNPANGKNSGFDKDRSNKTVASLYVHIAINQSKKKIIYPAFPTSQSRSYAKNNPDQNQPIQLQITHAKRSPSHNSSDSPRGDQPCSFLVIKGYAATTAALMLQGKRSELQQLLPQLGDIAFQQRAQPVGVVVQLVDLLVVFLFAGADFGGGEAVVFAGNGGFGCCCWCPFSCLVSMGCETPVEVVLFFECLLGLLLLRGFEVVI
jgi:hypothetical protein